MESKFSEEFAEWINLIKPCFVAIGFKKERLNWIKVGRNVSFLFNIQKSQFGNNVYINYGLFLLDIDRKRKHYLEYECHIRGRFDEQIGHEYLDFDNAMPVVQRAEKVIHLVRNNPFQFFSIEGEKEELIEFIRTSGSLAITRTAKEYLGIPII